MEAKSNLRRKPISPHAERPPPSRVLTAELFFAALQNCQWLMSRRIKGAALKPHAVAPKHCGSSSMRLSGLPGVNFVCRRLSG